MTRTWSDHYKLVILEKKGTEAQRGAVESFFYFVPLPLCSSRYRLQAMAVD